MKLLDRIDSPTDLKRLKVKELRTLAGEMRDTIYDTVTKNGGHLSSNLGVVELTIALHRVFDSPKDAIVWDVGHQCYAHKLLTGRRSLFGRMRQKGGLAGFPKRSESMHDIFDTGHSSTSLSSALGLLEARRERGDPGKVIAVIGDGAMTAGMAYEALSNVSQLKLPLVVVLNDNKMSISPNVGALSRYLSRLAASVRYQSFRSLVDSAIDAIPVFGKPLLDLVVRGKRAVKAIFFKDNLFSDLGFEYVGPFDGHNIGLLMGVFRQVKRLDRPVVVHVITRKGKGVEQAEEDPERFHGVSPSCSDDARNRPTYTSAFSEAALELASERSDLAAITAAMAKGTGLEALQKKFPDRVFDVGIAEQHAVTFAAGLAAGGLAPLVAIYSTFLQRSVDQVLHDVALPGLKVLFAVDRAGAVGEDGETHQGIYDIALFRSFPRMTIMAPSTSGELRAFLRAAAQGSGPVMLRYPRARVECEDEASMLPVEWGRGVFHRKRPGSDTLICALGPLAGSACAASDQLAGEGLRADVYSMRFVCPLDEDYLAGILGSYRRVLSVEDGIKSGGVGEALAALMHRRSIQASVLIMGFDGAPSAQASREELLSAAGLDVDGIAAALRGSAAAEGEAKARGKVPIAAW